MKQPKRLTRSQKAMLVKEGKDPSEWAVAMEGINSVSFIHKATRKIITLEK